MKHSGILIFLLVVIAILLAVLDYIFMSPLQDQFKEIEKQRIVISNKLTTAKIVHENLNHVFELVTENMVFSNQVDSISHETKFFQFITQCINDLKLELISVKTVKPKTEGAVTRYGYEVEIVGDFFKFGELCSKFENNRRIISVDKFKVSLETDKKSAARENSYKAINVSMLLTTYKLQKQIFQE